MSVKQKLQNMIKSEHNIHSNPKKMNYDGQWTLAQMHFFPP